MGISVTKILETLETFEIKCPLCHFDEWVVDEKIRFLVDASTNKDPLLVINVKCSLCGYLVLFEYTSSNSK